MTTFGLVGKKLGHSWSPKIHELLGSAPYELIELTEDEVLPFFHTKEWQALNVTIPYKAQAALAADYKSEIVAELGVANTLIQRNGKIYAENTDVLGFRYLINHFFEKNYQRSAEDFLAGKKVLILGKGGAAQAVAYVVEKLGAELVFIERTGEHTYDNLLEKHRSASLIINCTPVGMYPKCPHSLIDKETMLEMPKLAGLIDVVYNPIKTGLCLAAEQADLPFESGLRMLVAQAFYASELFQNKKLDTDQIERINHELEFFSKNIVFIGMPGSGKTSVGRLVAEKLGRDFVDMDELFCERYKVSPKDVILLEGEPKFRELESELAKELGKQSSLVIATGGGVVTREENYAYLSQNADLIYLNRHLEDLSVDERPLSAQLGVAKLFEQRRAAYEGWAKWTFDSVQSPEFVANKIVATISGQN